MKNVFKRVDDMGLATFFCGSAEVAFAILLCGAALALLIVIFG